jgi:hypothetical protein
MNVFVICMPNIMMLSLVSYCVGVVGELANVIVDNPSKSFVRSQFTLSNYEDTVSKQYIFEYHTYIRLLENI